MRTLVVALGLFALTIQAPAAQACINGVELSLRQETIKTSRAERLMRSGNLRQALRIAGPTLDDVQRAMSEAPELAGALRTRLNRVLAVTTVRLDGRVDRDTWRAVGEVTSWVREDNLEWARRTLAEQAQSTREPVDEARHAEALAALGRHEQAARILRYLAGQDLMPDAHGYATLARVEAALGQDGARDEAVQACRAMTSGARREICDLPATS